MIRCRAMSALAVLGLAGLILALLIGRLWLPDWMTMASADSEAKIKVFPHWVIASDITKADGVVLAFICIPGTSEGCPSSFTMDVTVTARDSSDSQLGSVTVNDVEVPGGEFFDFEPDVAGDLIESIAVEAPLESVAVVEDPP